MSGSSVLNWSASGGHELWGIITVHVYWVWVVSQCLPEVDQDVINSEDLSLYISNIQQVWVVSQCLPEVDQEVMNSADLSLYISNIQLVWVSMSMSG